MLKRYCKDCNDTEILLVPKVLKSGGFCYKCDACDQFHGRWGTYFHADNIDSLKLIRGAHWGELEARIVRNFNCAVARRSQCWNDRIKQVVELIEQGNGSAYGIQIPEWEKLPEAEVIKCLFGMNLAIRREFPDVSDSDRCVLYRDVDNWFEKITRDQSRTSRANAAWVQFVQGPHYEMAKSMIDTIRASHKWSELPILADYLEDAGYHEEFLIRHLRHQKPCHGCKGALPSCHWGCDHGWLEEKPLHSPACWALRWLRDN